VSLENALSQIVGFTATLDPRMAALLFIICAVGEFGISVPYVLESIWLLAGYQLGAGVLSPLEMVGLWLAAQCGRQAGVVALYHVAKFGSPPLVRFYHNRRLSRFIPKALTNSGVLQRINLASPFSVAFGRLFGLRVPLTLTLAVRERPRTLSIGVLLSSLVWDAIYISLGITVGTTAAIKPVQMLFVSVAGVTLIYLVTFLVRRLKKRFQPAGGSVSNSHSVLAEDENV
jgi:membrane-associated protein